MILAEKTTRTTRLRTGSVRWSPPARRFFHRRAGAAGPPAIQAGSISVDRRLFGEVRDWAILTGVSLTACASAAIAIGVV